MDTRKRHIEQQEQEEEDKPRTKRQRIIEPTNNRFLDLILNKHMFSIIHSFIGNDYITAARMRTAWPSKDIQPSLSSKFPSRHINPYFNLLTVKPTTHQITIKYLENDSSVQVFVRSVPPDYDHDARDDGIRIERIPGFPGNAFTHHPTLQFFMYMRPDALPLNKDEYSETFKKIEDVPSFYIKNAYTFVLDYMPFASRSHLSVSDVGKFNLLVDVMPAVQMIFLDNPQNGPAWCNNKKLLHPRTKYQIQFGSDAAIRVLDNEYSVYYSSSVHNFQWGRNLNDNQNRVRIYKWL